MTEKEFNNLLNDIDDELITRADKSAEKLRVIAIKRRVAIGFIAASLCLVLFPIYGLIECIPSLQEMFFETQPTCTVSFNNPATQNVPTSAPTSNPTFAPTSKPTSVPTANATNEPIELPSIKATEGNTEIPEDPTLGANTTEPSKTDDTNNIIDNEKSIILIPIVAALFILLFVIALGLLIVAILLLGKNKN